MDKRVFQIDDNCYIIYTGQSTADNGSFLRIGNSAKLTKSMQQHIRFIVVNDASTVNIVLEKSNIQGMTPGNIKYICSKQTHIELFAKLNQLGVNTKNFEIRNLSQDIDISQIENKKHFFTIFYDNKNVTIVSNEEVLFNLFECKGNKGPKVNDSPRLEALFGKLDKLNAECKMKPKVALPSNPGLIKKTDNLSAFFVQDDLFTPLTCGMFHIEKLLGNSAVVLFTNTQRFAVGRPIKLSMLNHADKKLQANGIIYEGNVVESKIMYKYLCKIDFTDAQNLAYFCQFFTNTISQ